ncbi:hypothetical protein C922_05231 [Plasmodium inui San Antonio 1]|uniref:Plasmodium RESA N-terminal domain-containing protein n=1 Tax=Plasmodium inui San Antonio 1 TaxID=1237626 RepID=W7AGE1_9APIC|nr:hypothetical protein C922_05231 [Plasmodium inui San Antonio 1]EUD64381.1 hypothetical protein C922_05231 [Plasmodium inui San Antonio 1]
MIHNGGDGRITMSLFTESQYGSERCSRLLTESFFRKTRKGHGKHKIADHNGRNDFENTSNNSHDECNSRDLIDLQEDARGSEGYMVRNHKKNKRTSVKKNGKRNNNREQYIEEQENYDEYKVQNGQYIDTSYTDGYGCYYGEEIYDENNRKDQTYADGEGNNHNYANGEYYNGEPYMYNVHKEETCPDTNDGSLDWPDNIMWGYSEDGEAAEADNTNNFISRVNDMGNTQTNKGVCSHETYKKSSQNSACSISQHDVDAMLENLDDLVQDTDMLNTFLLVNMIERNKFFDTLQGLMSYWHDYADDSRIPDSYKTKQWLKVLASVIDELMHKERKIYEELYHIIAKICGSKEAYITFIRDVRCTWIRMRQEIEQR